MSSDTALLQEIQRLSGAIDRHRFNEPKPVYAPRFHQGRSTYVNPAIANRKYINPAIVSNAHPRSSGGSSSQATTRELVIDGVAFESSSRKLTRKDLISNCAESARPSNPANPSANFLTLPVTSRPRAIRKGGNLISAGRIHKAKFTKGKRLGGRNNMVLDNIKGTRTGLMSKRRKTDKQCRFFTITGVCQRGLTCPYQHDPEKIAICPLFLTHTCPNTAETCHLSHDPNPSRVPLCHHFANNGRCTRDDCPYPHVRIGPRNGVCRDFAVVGYCDKGIDCDNQHVRECPDFAEKGVCPNRVCKLPHVIRANRRRQPTTSTQTPTQVSASSSSISHPFAKEKYDSTSSHVPLVPISTDSTDSGAAEEYISLTFEESDDEEDAGHDEEEEEEEDQDAMSTNDEKEMADTIMD